MANLRGLLRGSRPNWVSRIAHRQIESRLSTWHTHIHTSLYITENKDVRLNITMERDGRPMEIILDEIVEAHNG